MIKVGFSYKAYSPKQVGNGILFSISDKDKNGKWHYISVMGNSSQPFPEDKQRITIEAIEGIGLGEYKDKPQNTIFARWSIAPERAERPSEKYEAQEVINIESDDLPF